MRKSLDKILTTDYDRQEQNGKGHPAVDEEGERSTRRVRVQNGAPPLRTELSLADLRPRCRTGFRQKTAWNPITAMIQKTAFRVFSHFLRVRRVRRKGLDSGCGFFIGMSFFAAASYCKSLFLCLPAAKCMALSPTGEKYVLKNCKSRSAKKSIERFCPFCKSLHKRRFP